MFLFAKSIVIIFFLIMFLRTNKPAWGIGLLTVTSAILLDTFLGTLGREQMLDELGYFFYIIAGALFAGAVVWLWAIMKEFAFSSNKENEGDDPSEERGPEKDEITNQSEQVTNNHRQIAEQLRFDLSRDELLDLIFDLGWFDEETVLLQGENDQIVDGIVSLAETQGQLESLKLASERIKSPMPPEHLPRLEKLKEDSPPTLLRQFLIANYSMVDLEHMFEALDINGDMDVSRLKNNNVRYFLSDLYQKNRIDALIELMQQSSGDDSDQARQILPNNSPADTGTGEISND